MKILFLDIDGVLNNRDFIHSCKNGETHLSNPLIELLNQVIDQTGCKVILSSTWRLLYKLGYLRKLLADRGFRGEILGVTPDFSHIERPDDNVHEDNRAQEIKSWLIMHPSITRFAVIDDDPVQVNNFVQTSMKTGITQEHADALIKILC